MHYDKYNPRVSSNSLFFLLHQTYKSLGNIFIQKIFGYLLSLTSIIWMTIGLGLFIETCSSYQWVQNWRQWCQLSQTLSTAQRGGVGPCNYSLIHDCLWKGPVFYWFIEDNYSCSNDVSTLTVSCPENSIPQPWTLSSSGSCILDTLSLVTFCETERFYEYPVYKWPPNILS